MTLTAEEYINERDRYYYAIATCDGVDAASHIYSELEGAELERSANVFDLSFVPDDMTFDDECRWGLSDHVLCFYISLYIFRDEATDDPDTNFKGVDFVTDVRTVLYLSISS